MNICLIGNGLTNLVLAKNLVKKKIKVDLFYRNKIINKGKVRTIGISKENIQFLKKNIADIEKISWQIDEIKIYNELNQNEEIINFNNYGTSRFTVLKNHEIYNMVEKLLKKEKNFSKKLIKKNTSFSFMLNKKYDLIINSDPNSEITKKFFFNKINKEYDSTAYTTIINHKECKNNSAIQIFTKIGPIAFLPISNTETSIVFSILECKFSKNENQIINLIKKYNQRYKIISFNNFEKTSLKFSISRKYYYKNILCFGDNLHKIHPLAGQGFNMTIRDIKVLSKIIDNNLDLGLPLDASILKQFQKKTQHLNFVFAHGIDFIHEFFKFDNMFGNNYSKVILKLFGKNKFFNKYASKFADKGLTI